MKELKHIGLGVAALAALTGIAAVVTQATGADDRVKRGEYLAAIMDCGGCHTPGALRGEPDQSRALAGSDVGFEIPRLAIFYPPNLTPDRATGIGAWSAADIIKAVRTGERPDGRILAPVMPWHSYAKLTDADAEALAAYLKSLKPIRNKAPAITGPTEKPTAPFLRVVVPE
jgi:mono/diheme cytochrome c family protein